MSKIKTEPEKKPESVVLSEAIDLVNLMQFSELNSSDKSILKIATKYLAEYKELKESQEKSFEWCTGCKEYDAEKHCCHRFTKQIRKTLSEIISCDGCMKLRDDGSCGGNSACKRNTPDLFE